MTDAAPVVRVPHDGLVPLLRARKAELGMSDEELENRAFLCRGHVSKILGIPPSKQIGASVLATLMEALALDWSVVANAAKQAALDHLPRNPTLVRGDHAVGKVALRRVMRELGRKGNESMRARGVLASVVRQAGKARQDMLTARERTMLGRLGAQARWRKETMK